MTKMQQVKTAAAVLAALLAVVVIIQNTQSTETRVLFWTLTMPRAVLLAVTALLGFVAGVLATVRKIG